MKNRTQKDRGIKQWELENECHTTENECIKNRIIERFPYYDIGGNECNDDSSGLL